jgi:DNA-binding NarL/FixJ family response regulator
MGTVTPEDGRVPEPVSRAELRARDREAVRRREAAAALRLAATMSTYAARQLADGLSPEQARRAALEAAGELAGVAEQLRRLTRLRSAERRLLAVQLANFGLTTRQIAQQLGVSDKAARNYVAGRRSDGQPWAGTGA